MVSAISTFFSKQNFNLAAKQLTGFAKSDYGIALGVAFIWQIILTAIGGLFFDASLNNILQHGGAPATTLLSHTFGWDSGWYSSILNGAYSDRSSAASVFYPLFPLLVKIVEFITFGKLDVLAIGLLINTFSLSIALYGLKKIAYIFPVRYQWWPAILFLTSPAAIFMHLFYTEALFCAIAFCAYALALRRNWIGMGVLLGLLTATRLPAVLVVGLCGLEFLRAYEWNIKRILNRNLLYFLIAPAGFLLYGFYLQVSRGDFFAMSNGYKLTKDWAYQVFNPNILETARNGILHLRDVFTSSIPFDEGQSVNYLLPIIGLSLLGIASIYSVIALRKSIGVPLGIFGLVAGVFFTLNSNFVSVHRYLLPCIVIYISITHLAVRHKSLNGIFYAACYIGILLQAYLLILFVNGYFAG